MFRRFIPAAVLTLCLANFASAQGEQGDPPDPNNDAQTTDVQELQRQIGILQGRIDDLEAKVATLPAMANQVNDIANQLQGLDMDVITAMATQLQELSVAMSQIATQGTDGYDIDLLGKMNSSSTFREQMRRATQGRILFRNYTGVPQLVYVNGTAWNVTAGESYIDAAVGNVTAQMAYFELAPKTYDHWKFENGQYVLSIDIR